MNENGYTLSDIAAVSGGGCRNNNDGMFGGGDWGAWIILFLLFGLFNGNGWGGGFGGGNGANGSGFQGYATRADINEGFALNNLQSGITAIQQGICDSAYALNNSITNGFHGVDNAICNLGYQTQQGFNQTNIALMQGQNALSSQLADCCCENRAAIAQVRYDMATQACDTRQIIQGATRDLLENQNNNTRAILDFLTSDKIASLQAENQSLKLSASQANQNSVLMAAMDANKAEILRRTGAECPVPAYVVQPNTPVTFPTNSYGAFTGFNGYGNNCSCGC